MAISTDEEERRGRTKMTVDGRFGGLKGLGLKKKEDGEKGKKKTLWSRITKNADASTGLIARLFVSSLALLTHLFAPHCLLCLHAPLRSFARLLTPELVKK